MNNLAVAYRDVGRHEYELAMKESALELLGRARPPTHPDVVESLINLGVSYFFAGQTTKGLGCAREAVARRQEALPPGHPDTAGAERVLLSMEHCVNPKP